MGKIVSQSITRIETYSKPKLDLSIFKKRTNAKTPAGIVLNHAKKFRKDGNIEMAMYMQELYKQIYNLEESEKIRLEGWKGKSGLKLIEKPDMIVVEWYKKDDKGEKAKKHTTEIIKEEINKFIIAIEKLNEGKWIESRDLAEEVYKCNWDSLVFANRKRHVKFTQILNVLEYYGYVQYSRAGKVKVISNKQTIQEKLKGGKKWEKEK